MSSVVKEYNDKLVSGAAIRDGLGRRIDTTYLTTLNAIDTYLPLIGGTLTGTLTGTSAIFGALSVNGNATFTSTISGNINGNAGTASLLQNARNITIGNKTLSFNGGSDLAFTLAEIGAQVAGNYKTIQTAITSNSADTGSTTTFISSVTQDTNGVITAKTKTLDTSGTWSGTATNATHISPNTYTTEGNTVAQHKAGLATAIASQGLGVGDNITISESIISHWDENDATYYNSSVYSLIKIGGGYNNATWGQWMLSSYNLSRVGIVGRTNNEWSTIKWLAWTSDIPTNNNQLTNGAGYITASDSITGSAAQIKTNSSSTNANHYLTFVDSNNTSATAETLYTDDGIYYNPSSNTLNISGDLHIGSMLYAPIEASSLTVTGSSSVPTQTLGTNNNTIASTAFVRNEVAALVGSAPNTLDTLNELAAALGNDPNYATTISGLIGGKQAKVAAMGSVTQPVYVSEEGVFATCNSYPTKDSWNYDDVYLKLSGGTLTGQTVIKKDLGYTIANWVSGQHYGPFEVGRNSDTWTVAIGVTDDSIGYIQNKGYGISSAGWLVLNPYGDYTKTIDGTSYTGCVGIAIKREPHYTLDVGGTINGTAIYINGIAAVSTNDSRLSDARTPTAHTHKWANLDTTDAVTYNTAPEFGSVKIGNGTASTTATTHCTQQYDATNKCLKFVFV